MNKKENLFLKIENYFDVFIGVNRNQYKHDYNKLKGYEYNFVNSIGSSFLIDEFKSFKEVLDKPLEDKFLLKKSDIIVKLIGEVAFYYLNYSPISMAITSSFCIIRLKKINTTPPVSSIDLWAYFNSFYFKKWFKKLLQTNFYTFNLKISDIKNLSINVEEVNKNKSHLFFMQQKLNQLTQMKLMLINQIINYKLLKG